MISVKVENKAFKKDMNNLINYSLGFLEGVKAGKPDFLKSFGLTIIEGLKNYIDSNARVNPMLLHHVYEWDRVGSPGARLFDISYRVTDLGLTVNSTFSQSTSIKQGSNVPFYNKAKIMEDGTPITITPKNKVLAFTVDGEDIFTTKPVIVNNPGGQTSGEYEKVFDSFFNVYFTQAFLDVTGITAYLKNPVDFAKNFSSGKRGGRSKGFQTGKQWIAKAGLI